MPRGPQEAGLFVNVDEELLLVWHVLIAVASSIVCPLQPKVTLTAVWP